MEEAYSLWSSSSPGLADGESANNNVDVAQRKPQGSFWPEPLCCPARGGFAPPFFAMGPKRTGSAVDGDGELVYQNGGSNGAGGLPAANFSEDEAFGCDEGLEKYSTLRLGDGRVGDLPSGSCEDRVPRNASMN